MEHSPQGRYVRFNTKLEGEAYKEIWKAFDTSEGTCSPIHSHSSTPFIHPPTHLSNQTKQTGVEVAWNTLCLEEVPRSDKKRILNEIKILEKLDHNNIITFYTSWYNRETKRIVFITELMNNNNNGSLMVGGWMEEKKAVRMRYCGFWVGGWVDGFIYLLVQSGDEAARLHYRVDE